MTHPAEVTRVGRAAEARLVVDARGQICEANAAAHRLLHYEGASLVGLSLAWIMPPSRHALLEKLTQACQERARRAFSAVLLREDGSSIAVWMSTQPRSGPDGPWLALSLALDDEEPTSAVQRAGIADASGPAVRATSSPPPVPPAAMRPARGKTFLPPAALNQSFVRPAAASTSPLVTRTKPFAAHVNVGEQLTACMELLRWLDAHLQRQGAHETPRDRGLAQIALQEASALIELCQTALSLKAELRPDD